MPNPPLSANRINFFRVALLFIVAVVLLYGVVYPNLAVIGYVLASAAAFYLILSTFIRDRRDREKVGIKGK